MESLALLYCGNVVHALEDRSLALLEDHLLGVNESGLIAFLLPRQGNEHVLQSAQESSSATQLIQPTNPHSFLLPGFIDTHLHAPQYLYAGTALDVPLMEWLEKYTFRSESRIDADPHGLGNKVYTRLAQRCIENGTTCAALYGTISTEANLVLADAFANAGLRALVGKVNMDQNSPSYYTETTTQSLEETETFVSVMRSKYSNETARHKRLVEPIITPRFLPTCSKDLLRGLAKIAKDGQFDVQSHLSESGDEVAFTQSIYGNQTDSELFDEVGLLTTKSLFAHSTHISANDMQLLKTKGSSVSHCPLSNTYFSERAFPLREALDNDLKVGLGSDIAGGYSISLNDSMRWSVGVARSREGRHKDEISDPFISSKKDTGIKSSSNGKLDITWKESIYVVTLGGARAINRETYLGNFQPGKSFDAQLIQLQSDDEDQEIRKGNIDLFEDSFPTGKVGLEDVVEKWWSLGSVHDRAGVWVAGKRLL